jgi:hypothetical protein
MSLSGTWTITEAWDGMAPYSYNATFNSDGTVTIGGPNPGFAMVWYTGAELEQQEVVLAGDNRSLGILAVYYGTTESDGSVSGQANGTLAGLPVKGEWQAKQVSS